MRGLAFHFDEWDDDVWSGREVDLDAWRITAQNWGFDELAVINNTDRELRWPYGLPMTVYRDLDDFLAAAEGTIVSLQVPWKDCDHHLSTFDHSIAGDVWYVFGPAEGWGNPPGIVVGVEQNGRDAHHALFLAPIVAYDRHMRS